MGGGSRHRNPKRGDRAEDTAVVPAASEPGPSSQEAKAQNFAIRKALVSGIQDLGLDLDVNAAIKAVVAVIDAVAAYDPAAWTTAPESVDFDAIEDKIKGPLAENAELVVRVMNKVRTHVRPRALIAAAAPAPLPVRPANGEQDAKQHRAERRGRDQPNNSNGAADRAGILGAAGASAEDADGNRRDRDGPVLQSPPQASTYRPPLLDHHVPVLPDPPMPRSSFATPAQPIQIPLPYRPGQLPPPPPPRSANVIVTALHPSFNTAANLVRLAEHHTSRAPRFVVPNFPAGNTTSAFMRLHSTHDAAVIVAAHRDLVAGFPGTFARGATIEETNEARAVRTADIERDAGAALLAMQQADAVVGRKPAESIAGDEPPRPPLVVAKEELAQYRTELELLTALGPAADAQRKLAVLQAMQTLIAQIKQLETNPAPPAPAPPSEADGSAEAPPAAATTDAAANDVAAADAPTSDDASGAAGKPTFSSSAADVENPNAIFYIKGFREPVHDARLLALLRTLDVRPKSIWRAPDSTDICVEVETGSQVADLVERYLHPTFGKFGGLTFSRRRDEPPVENGTAAGGAPETVTTE